MRTETSEELKLNQPASLWSKRRLQQVVKWGALGVVGVGGFVLLGWLLDLDFFKSPLPGVVTMKPNTALSFGLAGFSLWLMTQPTTAKRRWIGRFLSWVVMAIAIATLSQYLFGWELGIDQLVFHDPAIVGTVHPGRMSLLTAICFVLVGVALGIIGIPDRQVSTAHIRWVEFLALLTIFIAAQSVIAHLYRVQPIIGFVPYTQMALYTAICLIILGIGLLLLYPDQGITGIITANSVGGTLARRLLPAAILIPLCLGGLRIISERTGWLEPDLGSTILIVLNIIIFLALISWTARLLHQVDLQRRSAVEALYQVNEKLEARIRERTRELRQANERLNLAIEGAGMGTVDLDLQTGKSFWSAQYFRLLGYDPIPTGEPTREMWQNRVHPDDLPGVLQASERVQQARSLLDLEHRIIRADDRQVAWLRVFGRYFYNDGGQAVRFIGVLFDNTEKKRAQEERDRFFTLSLDMLCIAGLDGYFKQLNPAWERILGYTPEELMAQPFLNFVHPEDRVRTTLEAEHHAAGAPAINFENRYRCKDGSYKWLEWTAVPAAEDSLLYAVARDVSARKQIEQQLAQQAADLKRQADLLELTYEAIIVRDQQGAITYWNRGAESLYGWSRSEAMGKVTHKLLNTRLTTAANLDTLVLQQVHWQGELIHTCKAGQQITVESRQVVICDEQGNPTGFLEVNRDITERKRAEAEIRQLNATLEQRVKERTAQLQEANQDLETFSYTVAHDLRAPLRGIQGFAQALLEDYGSQLDETARHYIHWMVQGVERMDELVQDLLTYSRLSRQEVVHRPVQLNDVVAEAQAQIHADVRDRHAHITVVGDLPLVLGHHSLLVQVVTNLLSNAIKFVATDVQPQIQIWAEVQDYQVRLWVQDNGIGIEPQHQEQIFGVFERLHGSETYPGTGIGLAIVRKGVERLGGQVGVDSAINEGSRFWLELQQASLNQQLMQL